MNRQNLRSAAAGAALLLALFGAPLAADAACQWAGITDPALEQAQPAEGR